MPLMTQPQAIRACFEAIGGDGRGAASTVAKHLGVSRAAVWKILNGGQPSPEVAIRMVEMARARGVLVTLHEVLPGAYPESAREFMLPPRVEPSRVPLGGRKKKGDT